jgi:uncharacterized membrane protein
MATDMRTAFEEAAGDTNIPSRRAVGGGNNAPRALDVDPARLAAGLGWLSVGLGLLEVAAPRQVARLAGLPDDQNNQRNLRLFGLRELASGIGLLSRPEQSSRWIKSRVAGDALDLALLGGALSSEHSNKNRIIMAAAAIAGVTALDVMCNDRLSKASRPSSRQTFSTWLERKLDRRICVTRTVTINRPVEELYAYWRQLDNLPRIMPHLESVEVLDERRSRWKAKAPLGVTIEWVSEITEDEPNRRLAWQSLPDATVRNSGSVRFEPTAGNRGTVIHLDLNYDPPAGRIGSAFAKLVGRAPEQELQKGLRDFKQIMEVGEVTLSDASAKGWGAGQPPEAYGSLEQPMESIADNSQDRRE